MSEDKKGNLGMSNARLAWIILGVVAFAFVLTLWKFRPL